MLRRIPKRFQMGPHTIQVRIVTEKRMRALVRELCEEDPNELTPVRGLTEFEANVIYVQRVGKDFPKESQLHAFWHEYFHILLYRASRERLAMDEVLVDTLGGLQQQAFKTFEY